MTGIQEWCVGRVEFYLDWKTKDRIERAQSVLLVGQQFRAQKPLARLLFFRKNPETTKSLPDTFIGPHFGSTGVDGWDTLMSSVNSTTGR